MTLNPLLHLRILDKKNIPPNLEPFAGPYRANESQWLFAAAADALKSHHAVYFTRTVHGTKTTVTLHLERAKFDETTTQHPREIFETIDNEEAKKAGVEKHCWKRCHTFADCVEYLNETIRIGHLPVFVESPEESGLVPGFIRRHIDAKPKKQKSNTTQTSCSAHTSEPILTTIPKRRQEKNCRDNRQSLHSKKQPTK
jgi:hypothetical protein